MNWVVKMNKNHGLQFKSYVNQLVVNLEDADPEVRNVAKTAIVQLYQNAPGTAQVNLKKQLAAHNVRKGTVAFITSHLDDAAAADDHSAEPAHAHAHAHAPAPAPAPVRERPLPAPRSKTLQPDVGFADSLAAEQPPPTEAVVMDPIHIYTQRELEDILRDMAPPFEGRENEQNWIGRDKNTLKLRRILKGNAPTEFHAAFVAGVKSLLDGILKVANTLRTTMSTNGCQLVQELAEGVAQQGLVAALEQVDAHGCARAARMAAITSAVRRAPRTSWARNTRQPLATPSAWAAWLARRRSATSSPRTTPKKRLFDADRNRGQPRAERRSWARSSSSD